MDTTVDSSTTDSTLYLTQIPPINNTIHNLKSHSSKFGEVLEVKVSYKSDPSAAAITFMSRDVASTAFLSSELILNNRSIKKSWYPSHSVSTSKSKSSSPTSSEHRHEPKTVGFECVKVNQNKLFEREYYFSLNC